MSDTKPSSAKQPTAPDVRKVLRQVRDAGLESAARIVLAVTSSHRYQRASSLLAKPGFVVSALAREKTDTAMRTLLSRVNMPSRTDVLALSRRLTHIEMALDDLSANVDAIRATASGRAAHAAGGGPAVDGHGEAAGPASAHADHAPKRRRAPRRTAAAPTAAAEVE